MPSGSSRVTRHRAKEQSKYKESSDESDHDQDLSYASTRSQRSESSISSPSFVSRDGSFGLENSPSHSSIHSNSPNKSYGSPSSGKLYPQLPKDLDDSGYSNVSQRRSDRIKEKNKLYPDISSTARHESSIRSRKESSSSNEKASELPDNTKWWILAVLVVIALVLYMLWPNDTTIHKKKSDYELFEDDIQVLKRSFPGQTKRFWNTMSASARHVFYQQDPCYPSVILMASQSKNKNLVLCLAKKIAVLFSTCRGADLHGSLMGTDVEDFKHLEPEHQKLYLDNALQSTFQEKGGKAFIISNVHFLAPKAALLLHGFCDGDNAPYKDVMIILTFQVDDNVAFQSVKDVEDHLTKIWSRGLDMDKLSAVMSRIANNPVVIMPEKESVVNKMCS